MTDKEKIKEEVERIIEEEQSFYTDACKNGEQQGSGSPMVVTRMQMLLKFIDSLSKEPISEDLEEAANDYAHDIVHDDVFETFIAGAKWQNKRTMDTMKRKQIYNDALYKYGIDAQKWMLVEECGEILNAIAKLKRGRATKEEITTELADVHIMVEQMAFFYGWDEFKAEKERKLLRLRDRLEHFDKEVAANGKGSKVIIIKEEEK